MASRRAYILERFLFTVFSLWAILTIVFLLFRILPGDPAAAMLPPTVSQEARDALNARYGLDEPLYVQYALFMKNLILEQSLGVSFQSNDPVTPLVVDKMIKTMSITVTALITSFLVGPVIGSYMAWYRGGVLDKYGTGLVLSTWAAPIFWTGMLALLIFSFTLGWFPARGMRGSGYTPGGGYADLFLSVDFLQHAVLPFMVYFLARLSQPTLYMRNNMVELLGAEFIELKESIGYPDGTIRLNVARNALLPVLHYGALALGFAFGGSVILETVFSWPGIGQELWSAVLERDYPVAQGAFFLIASVVVILNFIVDVISVYIDPRVAEEGVE